MLEFWCGGSSRCSGAGWWCSDDNERSVANRAGLQRWRVHAMQDPRRPSERSCKSEVLLLPGFDGAGVGLLSKKLLLYSHTADPILLRPSIYTGAFFAFTVHYCRWSRHIFITLPLTLYKNYKSTSPVTGLSARTQLRIRNARKSVLKLISLIIFSVSFWKEIGTYSDRSDHPYLMV